MPGSNASPSDLYDSSRYPLELQAEAMEHSKSEVPVTTQKEIKRHDQRTRNLQAKLEVEHTMAFSILNRIQKRKELATSIPSVEAAFNHLHLQTHHPSLQASDWAAADKHCSSTDAWPVSFRVVSKNLKGRRDTIKNLQFNENSPSLVQSLAFYISGLFPDDHVVEFFDVSFFDICEVNAFTAQSSGRMQRTYPHAVIASKPGPGKDQPAVCTIRKFLSVQVCLQSLSTNSGVLCACCSAPDVPNWTTFLSCPMRKPGQHALIKKREVNFHLALVDWQKSYLDTYQQHPPPSWPDCYSPQFHQPEFGDLKTHLAGGFTDLGKAFCKRIALESFNHHLVCVRRFLSGCVLAEYLREKGKPNGKVVIPLPKGI